MQNIVTNSTFWISSHFWILTEMLKYREHSKTNKIVFCFYHFDPLDQPRSNNNKPQPPSLTVVDQIEFRFVCHSSIVINYHTSLPLVATLVWPIKQKCVWNAYIAYLCSVLQCIAFSLSLSCVFGCWLVVEVLGSVDRWWRWKLVFWVWLRCNGTSDATVSPTELLITKQFQSHTFAHKHRRSDRGLWSEAKRSVLDADETHFSTISLFTSHAITFVIVGSLSLTCD